MFNRFLYRFKWIQIQCIHFLDVKIYRLHNNKTLALLYHLEQVPSFEPAFPFRNFNASHEIIALDTINTNKCYIFPISMVLVYILLNETDVCQYRKLQ